jgi:acetyltransferase-like isoleucine patch superfamily enzyme
MWTYGRPRIIYAGDGARLRIGRFCSIAPDVLISLGGEHHTEWITTYSFSLLFDEAADLPGYPMTRGDVAIGNDVWIGQGACILSGVTVGDGAVIAARTVIAKDVDPYSIVGGSPARLVRYRFPEAAITSLLELAWWNWSLPQIKQAWPLLMSGDIEMFISKYGVDSMNKAESEG